MIDVSYILKGILKRISFFLMVFLLSCTVVAQFNYFSKCYNPFETWSGCTSIIGKNDGFVGVGISSSATNGYRQILFIFLNNNGDLLDWKGYGTAPDNYYPGKPGSLIETSDGGYALAGSIDMPDKGVGHFMKFDNNMDTLWTITFEFTSIRNSSFLILNQCKQTFDGGFILVGDAMVATEDHDILLIKTDSLGNMEWQNYYGGNWIGWIESGWSVDQTSDSGFVIGGYTYNLGYAKSNDAIVIKTDRNGNQEWKKCFGGEFKDGLAAVAATLDSNIVVGYSHATSQDLLDYPFRQFRMLKLTNQGDTLWQKSYDQTRMVNLMYSLRETENGDIIAVGTTNLDTPPFEWGWILKATSEGDSVWMKYYKKVENDISLNRLFDVSDCSDNGYVSCGYVLPVNEPPYAQSMWVLKVDSLGNDSSFWVGFDHNLASKIQFLNIYPNPSAGFVNLCVKYTGAWNTGHGARFEIFDLWGRKVDEVIVPARQETVRINVSKWNAGVYLAVLRTGNKIVGKEKFVVQP